jgi:hypothetical protein
MKNGNVMNRLIVPCAYCGHSISYHTQTYEYKTHKPTGRECLHGFDPKLGCFQTKICGCKLDGPKKKKKVDHISQPCVGVNCK